LSRHWYSRDGLARRDAGSTRTSSIGAPAGDLWIFNFGGQRLTRQFPRPVAKLVKV